MFEQEYKRANDRIHPRKDLLKEMEAKWAAEADQPAEETGKVAAFPAWVRYGAMAAGILLCVGLGMGSVMLFSRSRAPQQSAKAEAQASVMMDSGLPADGMILTETTYMAEAAPLEMEEAEEDAPSDLLTEAKAAPSAQEAPQGMHAAVNEAEVEDAVRNGQLDRGSAQVEPEAAPPQEANDKDQQASAEGLGAGASAQMSKKAETAAQDRYAAGQLLRRDDLMAVFLPTSEQIHVVRYANKKLSNVFSLTLQARDAQVKQVFWMDDEMLAVRERNGETELLRFGVADWKAPKHLQNLTQSGAFLGAGEIDGRLVILSLYQAGEEEPLPWVNGERIDYGCVLLDEAWPGDTFTVLTVYDPGRDAFSFQTALLAESVGVTFGHGQLLLWTAGAEARAYALSCAGEGLILAAEGTTSGTVLSAGEAGEGFSLLLQRGDDVVLRTVDGALNEISTAAAKGAGPVRWGEVYEDGAAFLTGEALHWLTASQDRSLALAADAFHWLTVDRALVYSADGQLHTVAVNADGLAALGAAQVRDSLALLVEDPSRMAYDAATNRLVFPAGQKVYQYRIDEAGAFIQPSASLTFSDHKETDQRELRCLMGPEQTLIFCKDGIVLCNQNLARQLTSKY